MALDRSGRRRHGHCEAATAKAVWAAAFAGPAAAEPAMRAAALADPAVVHPPHRTEAGCGPWRRRIYGPWPRSSTRAGGAGGSSTKTEEGGEPRICAELAAGELGKGGCAAVGGAEGARGEEGRERRRGNKNLEDDMWTQLL